MRDHSADPEFDSLFEDSPTPSQTQTLPSGRTFSGFTDDELDINLRKAQLAQKYYNWTAAPHAIRKRGNPGNKEIVDYWKKHDYQPESGYDESALLAKRIRQGIDQPSTVAASSQPPTVSQSSNAKTAPATSIPAPVRPQKPISESPQHSQTATGPLASGTGRFTVVSGLFGLSYKQFEDGTTDLIRDDGYRDASIYVSHLNDMDVQASRRNVKHDDGYDSGIDMSYDEARTGNGPTVNRNEAATPGRSRARDARRMARAIQGQPEGRSSIGTAGQAPSSLGAFHGQSACHADEVGRPAHTPRTAIDVDPLSPRGTQFSDPREADDVAMRQGQFSRGAHRRSAESDFYPEYDDAEARRKQFQRDRSSDDPSARYEQFRRLRAGHRDPDDASARYGQFQRKHYDDTGVDLESDRHLQFSRMRDADEGAARRMQFSRDRASAYPEDEGYVSDIGDMDEDSEDARRGQMSRHETGNWGSLPEDREQDRREQFSRPGGTAYDDPYARESQMRRERSPPTEADTIDEPASRRDQFRRHRYDPLDAYDTGSLATRETADTDEPDVSMHGANGKATDPESSFGTQDPASHYDTRNTQPESFAPPQYSPRAPQRQQPSTATPYIQPTRSGYPGILKHTQNTQDSLTPETRTENTQTPAPTHIAFADRPHDRRVHAYEQPDTDASGWPTRGPLSSIPPAQRRQIPRPIPTAESAPAAPNAIPSYDFSIDDDDDEDSQFTFEDSDSQRQPRHAQSSDSKASQGWSTGAKVAAGLGTAAGVAGSAYYLYNHPETITNVSEHAGQAWEGVKGAASTLYNDPGAAWEATKSGVSSFGGSMRDTGSSLYTSASGLVPSPDSVLSTAAKVTSSVGGALSAVTSRLPGTVTNLAKGAAQQLVQRKVAQKLQSAAGL